MQNIQITAQDALIIIDPQVDFCPGGALAVEGGHEIIPAINVLAIEFREAGATVVATQDWHPLNQISFASTHGVEPFSDLQVEYGVQKMWPDHCVNGTAGAEFHPSLDTNPVQMVIRKGTNPAVDSYSAFYENDKKTKTGLTGYLQALGVKRVFLVGLAYDYCVGDSAVDAVKDGFEAVVIKDLTRAISTETAGIMGWKLVDAGVQTINSEQI